MGCWAFRNILNQLNCFVSHQWFALSVFYRDGKFLLKIVGIFSFPSYSWTIRLQIVRLGTHGMPCLFSFVMENSCLKQLEFLAYLTILGQLDCRLFWAYQNIIGELDYKLFSLACMVCSIFFDDGNFLLKAFGSLSLINWIADCLVWRAWFEMSILFCVRKI